MGLFVCEICGYEGGLGDPDRHVCRQEDILAYIRELKEAANEAALQVRDIQNAVYRLLEDVPSLDAETVVVKTEWLRQLWDAARCNWKDSTSIDTFLVRWIAMHRILAEAFDVFRSIRKESLIEKLSALRRQCDCAKDVFGYDSNLDLTPEQVAKQ